MIRKALELPRLVPSARRLNAHLAAENLALRQQLGGRFRRVRDLLRVRGIGYRTLKRIEPLVVLDPPAAPERP